MSRTTDPRALLAVAWDRWEEKPGHPDRAREMNDACIEVAASLGLTTNAFRAALSEARRAGLDRPAALARVLASR